MKAAKWFRRGALILSSSASSILVPLLGLIVSALVIRLYSQRVWGAFVQVLIIVQFAVHLVAWGNREFLLRAFSRAPAGAAARWRDSLLTRLLLFIGLTPAVLLINASGLVRFMIIFWAFGLILFDAFHVLVVYHKDFLRLVVIEAAAFGLTVVYLLLAHDSIDPDAMVGLFAAVTAIKTGYFFFHYRSYAWPLPAWESTRLDLKYFGMALPFFALGFSGMLNSRVDLYAVGLLLPPAELARYQVSINMFLYLQAIAAAMVTPFIKNLYRLEIASVRRFSRRLTMIGLGITAVGTPLIYLLLKFVYGFSFPFSYFAVGYAFVVPMYYTLPIIYTLYRMERQNLVLTINLVGIGLNLALNLVLVPVLGLIGALISTTIVRWSALAVYHERGKRIHQEYEYALEPPSS